MCIHFQKCEGIHVPEYRKFSVDPQITSFEVLQSILAKAFDIRGWVNMLHLNAINRCIENKQIHTHICACRDKNTYLLWRVNVMLFTRTFMFRRNIYFYCSYHVTILAKCNIYVFPQFQNVILYNAFKLVYNITSNIIIHKGL